jgi:hypothetical protein
LILSLNRLSIIVIFVIPAMARGLLAASPLLLLCALLPLLAAAYPYTSTTPTLSANATMLRSGDWVRVSFTGIPVENRGANGTCWVGLFPVTDNVTYFDPPNLFPWSAPWVAPAPVKFQFCNATMDVKFPTTGDGYIDVVVYNLRQNLMLWMFLDGLNATKSSATPVAGPILAMRRQEEPMQARLARTSDASEMLLTWTSKNAKDMTAAVKYGINPDSLDSIIVAETHSYTADSLCGSPANSIGWWNPGTFYTVVMTGLKPNTRYYYKFGSDGTWIGVPGEESSEQAHNNQLGMGWSETHDFMSAPPVDPHQRQRVFVIADVGVSQKDGWQFHWAEPQAHLTLAGVDKARNKSESEILIHVGDISYATGYLAKWDEFMHEISPVSREMPYMVSEGNHERDFPGSGSVIGGSDSGGECGVTTEQRFIMPTSNQSLFWYSLNQGNIHIVMINTELNVSVGSPQYQWIQEDLSTVNRSETPWVVFTGHRPMYTGAAMPPRDPWFADPLEPLLLRYKVDMCFWGHYHSAELTWPVYNSTRIPVSTDGSYDAPVHAVIGNGGMWLTTIPTNPGPWMRWLPVEQYYGWNELVAENATHLTFTMLRDDNGKAMESITIVRNWPRNY